MPPKKETLKKGVVYKPPTPSKDIVPPTIKQLPREPRATKPLPEFPEQEFKNEFELKQKLEPWPGNEAAKTFDFGTELFSDPLNHLVTSFFNEKIVVKWKSMKVIEKLQSYQEEEEEEDDTSIHEIHSQNNVNYIYEDDGMDEEGSEYKVKELVMVDSIYRDETLEEIEKRKAADVQKLGKDKKKVTKKDETKDENLPQKVRDVELSDVETHNYMFSQSRWIGGHLQLIKDRGLRDVYTGEPVWRKIYPQVDGIPVLSKSGRYWVKLYHMGVEVKMEVDSELPIDNKCRYLFPLSKKHHEKWTLIVTKAIIKLISINNSPVSNSGDGMTLYALTGLISETIPLNSFTNWTRLGEYLNDEHYTDRDIVVTCYSSSKFKPLPPSNLLKSSHEKQYNKLFEFGNSDFSLTKKRLERSNSGHLPVFEFDEGRDEPEVIETGIEADRSYLLGDFIYNGPLNMAYVQNRSLKEMTLKHAYNELNQVSLSTKTKDQKLEHRKKKKDLKEKIHREEEKRLEMMNQPNRPQYFIKVNSNLKIHCKYSKEELFIAKKCLKNGLLKPPNYEVYDPKEDTRSLMSSNLVVKKEEKQKDEMTIKALDDFSSIPHAVDPMERGERGVWIHGDDFLKTFEYIQFYYNPQKLQNQVHKIDGQNGVEFTVEKTKEVLMIEKQNTDEKTVLLFGFAPEYPKQLKQAARPYSILQKFNFDEYVAIEGTPPLQDPLSCFRLELPNQNHLYRIVTVARSGYCYWVSSNANFRLMSIASYLTEYQNYIFKQFSTDYLPAEANKYNLYFRLEITGGKESNILLIKLKGMDFNILKYLRYKLIKPCQPNDKNLLLEDGKYFEEKALIVDIQNKIDIEPETKYYLLLEGVLPFNLRGSTVDIDIYTKSELKVELVENVEPLKYVERYVPNKYGLICRQRLFVNADTVATLLFQIVEAEVPQKDLAVDKKAPPKKGGKQEGAEVNEVELKEKRTIRFQLYKGNELIAAKMGGNITLISNIEILSTKSAANNYFIQAMFNLHEWPEAKDPQYTANICWSLKVTSSESIAVVRDTFQEDKDRQIKRLWEEQDPGRAERAKKSRTRYLIEAKQRKGEKLTEEEISLVTQPRLTKKQILEEQKKLVEQKGKSKAPPKKDDKKGKKEEVKVVVEEQKKEDFPRAEGTVMAELHKYLAHLESARVIELENEGVVGVRSEENLRALKEAALMSEEDRVGHITRNIRNREASKILQSDRKQTLEIFFGKVKEELKANWVEYVGKRNSLFEETKVKSEKDKTVISLLRGEKTLATEAEMEKAVKEYGAFEEHSVELLEGLRMLEKNKKIGVLSDRLASALPLYDIEEIKKIRSQIDSLCVQGLNPELVQQLQTLEEEFRANPNLIAEKQAQLKKQKKGGKK